jgi:hypothetical protein
MARSCVWLKDRKNSDHSAAGISVVIVRPPYSVHSRFQRRSGSFYKSKIVTVAGALRISRLPVTIVRSSTLCHRLSQSMTAGAEPERVDRASFFGEFAEEAGMSIASIVCT